MHKVHFTENKEASKANAPYFIGRKTDLMNNAGYMYKLVIFVKWHSLPK